MSVMQELFDPEWARGLLTAGCRLGRMILH